MGQFIYDFQTLIAGGLALVAAFIAVRPVREQLKLLRLESAISAREVLRLRVNELEERERQFSKLRTDLTRDILIASDEDGEWFEDPSAEWAFNTEQVINGVRTQLTREQRSLKDTSEIDAARGHLIKLVWVLEATLDAIHRPESMSFEDEDVALTEERQKVLQQEASSALSVLDTEVSEVFSSCRKVSAAFASAIKQLREKIRAIDAAVADHRI